MTMKLVNKFNSVFLVLLVITMSLLVVGCKRNKDNGPTVNSIELTTVEDRIIYVGETLQVSVTIDPADIDLSKLTWKSSNESVATVNNGVVTGVGAGTSVISASMSKKSANIVVTVEATPSSKEVLCEPEVLTENPIALDMVELALYEKETGYIVSKYNPYDYKEINVYAEFTAPSGDVKKIYGFWYKDYELTLNTLDTSKPSGVSGTASTNPNEPQGRENATFTSEPDHFRLRFTPEQEGTYTVRVFVEEIGFLVQTMTKQITISQAATDNNYRGVMKIDQTNKHHFVDEYNKTFITNGVNLAWWTSSTRKTVDYDVWMDSFSRNGGNMARVWMATWGFAIHWQDYDNFDKGQAAAKRLDKLFEYCDEYSIYLQLALVNHGQFSSQTNPLWNENPWNVKKGGILESPAEFFFEPVAKEIYKTELRYIIARYGYSDKLLAWELFNEVDWTDGGGAYNNPSYNELNIKNWHKEMAQFVKANDAYNHLITTSYCTETGMAYSLPEIDFTNPHNYGYTGTHVVTKLASAMKSIYNKYNKPVLQGELGINWESGHESAKADPTGISIRQATWAGMMSGGLGGGMQWWWDSWIHPNNLWYLYQGAGLFANKMDLTGTDYSFLHEDGNAILSNSKAGALGYKFNDRVYGYIYNLDWKYYVPNVANINNLTYSIPMQAGSYTVTFYNSVTGAVISTQTVSSVGVITLNVPTFAEDIAFIIE